MSTTLSNICTEAIDWATANGETLAVSGRIHGINKNTIKSKARRQRLRHLNPPKPVGHAGGQNRVLSDAQIKAILEYINYMRLTWGGATKEMVFAAIAYLKKLEGCDPPSNSWFNKFLSTRQDLFKVVKTKPIARNRVSAQDEKVVREWFQGWVQFCEKNGIEAEDILNFDEKGFQAGITSGEYIIVPAEVKSVCIFLI